MNCRHIIPPIVAFADDHNITYIRGERSCISSNREIVDMETSTSASPRRNAVFITQGFVQFFVEDFGDDLPKNNEQEEPDQSLNVAQRTSTGGRAWREGIHSGYGQEIVRFEPSSILKEGNSDPFFAFAIPINANANYLMHFCRDTFLPDINRDITNPQGKGTLQAWSECILYLQDECCAYAQLA